MTRLLKVTWTDAFFEYEDPGRAPEYTVKTVGFIVNDGPRFLSLAQEVLPDGTFRAVTHIPLESIEQKEELP